MDPIRDGYDAVGSSPDRLNGHCIMIAESTIQPFKRSPVEDGRNVALPPFKLGVHLVKGVNAEVYRATDELSRLRDMLESAED